MITMAKNKHINLCCWKKYLYSWIYTLHKSMFETKCKKSKSGANSKSYVKNVKQISHVVSHWSSHWIWNELKRKHDCHWQHTINWKAFNDNKCVIFKPDIHAAKLKAWMLTARYKFRATFVSNSEQEITSSVNSLM